VRSQTTGRSAAFCVPQGPIHQLSKPKPRPNSNSPAEAGFEKRSPPTYPDQECEHGTSTRMTLDERARPARRVRTPSILADRPRRESREDINAAGCGRVVSLIAHGETATNDRLEIKAPRYRSRHPYADVSRRYAASKDPVETCLESDRSSRGRLRRHDGYQQERERRSGRAVHLLCSHNDRVQERWRTAERVSSLARRGIGDGS